MTSNRGGVGSLERRDQEHSCLSYDYREIFFSFFQVFIPPVSSRRPSPGEEEVGLVPDRQAEAVDVVAGETVPALTADAQTQV